MTKNKPTQEDLNILQEYYDINIPQLLRDTGNDEYDFIADNTFLSGIVFQAIKGKDISQFNSVRGYMDSEYQEAKKRMLDVNTNTANQRELVQYFEAYEKAVAVLQKLLIESLCLFL